MDGSTPGPSVAMAAAGMPALRRIWDDHYCKKCMVDGVDGWECLRCGMKHKPVHHTRACAHFAKMPNEGVKVCTAEIPNVEFRRYLDLWQQIKSKKGGSIKTKLSISETKEYHLDTAVEQLMETKKKRTKISTELQEYYDVVGSSKSTYLPSGQPAIDTAFENMKQQDLNQMNQARMDVSIATFFHENNLSDSAAESPAFAMMIKNARLVGSDYKCPPRKAIGGSLLDLNYKNCQERNKKTLLAEADTFGLSWLSDGATISRMPLINILGLCANHPPTCVKIHDCTGHMTEGNKKDASYIAGLMEDVVLQYDPDKSRTTLFWFDGASNVQKAGRILEAKFPRAYSLHGGEHVVSLFFSDVSKLLPIKASISLIFLTIYVTTHI